MAKKKAKNKSNYTAPEERVDAKLVESGYELLPREEADADGELFDLEALQEQGAAAEAAGAPHNAVIQTVPSEIPNAYVSQEEQGMEMRPAVVGPPAYGSPDPLTSAGRLLPLEQHPLRAENLPEDHPAAISEDYGQGYDHTLRGTETLRSAPITAASDLERHTVGDFSKEELEEANEKVDATSGALELAEAEGVNLQEVEGTGQGGRVTKDDVENFLASQDDDGDSA